MSWYFDPNRATQAASFLITCSGESRMQYLKMLKLLYLADRESMREKGHPITGDDAYAMDYGPVLTHIYDYVKCKSRRGAHVWSKYFRTDGYELERIEDPGIDELSPYDRRILQAVFSKHNDLDGFDLSNLSHYFPEWKESYRGDGTSTAIPLEELLNALGVDAPEDRAEIAETKEMERRYFEDIENLKNGLKPESGRLLSA